MSADKPFFDDRPMVNEPEPIDAWLDTWVDRALAKTKDDLWKVAKTFKLETKEMEALLSTYQERVKDAARDQQVRQTVNDALWFVGPDDELPIEHTAQLSADIQKHLLRQEELVLQEMEA